MSRLVPHFTCHLMVAPGLALRVEDNRGRRWDVDPAAVAASPGRELSLIPPGAGGHRATVELLWRTPEAGHTLRLRRPKSWRHALVPATEAAADA